MKRSVLAIFVCVFLKTLYAADSSALSDFERSLMDVQTSQNEFEQSLLNQEGSELEPVYKAREELLDAIRNKDTATVSQKIEELENMQSYPVKTIHAGEKFAAYNDLKMYRAMLKMLVQRLQNAYDSTSLQNEAYAGNDGLMAYAEDYINKFASKSLYEGIERYLDTESDLTEAEIHELRLMLYLPMAYDSRDNIEKVRTLASYFVENYSDHPDAEWVRTCVLEPLERASFRVEFLKDRNARSEEIIASRFYTGGIGFNVYFLGGGFGYSGHYRKDLAKPSSYPVNGEVYLQLSRLSVSGELINAGHKGVINLGMSFGFVAYDSRYWKIRPYVGFSKCLFNADPVKPYFDSVHNGKDYSYYSFDDWGSEDTEFFGSALTLGVNVDLKFATSFRSIDSYGVWSVAVVSKFGVSQLDMKKGFPVTRGNGHDVFFALGLGLYFW